ncbi:MAG: hypothetical protein K6T99_11115 [Armatimonadetes bacterium]|nr:hypothetical protein [Armatimonadota bacterium]
MRLKIPRIQRAVFLSLILLCLSTPVHASSQTESIPTTAPPNPAFLRYLQETALVNSEANQSIAKGLIPPPLDLSHSKGERISTTRTLVGFPSSFDLRNLGKVTPIRNQGSCGSCWAFATYGSMESCLLPDETWDLSENNLKNQHGFDPTCCAGGNHWMSTAYLARWDGPIIEGDDIYNASSCTSPTGLAIRKHVQAVDFIPDRAGPLDNNNIKQAVMTYGAVYTTFYWNSYYFNYSTCAYYFNGMGVSNHAVCIVGWDDNYPASNFYITPPGNGAFIIKNSWGTSWGSNGYLYISYYDTCIGTDNALFHSAEPTINYKQVYQYDPLGWVSSLGYGNTTGWFANVFTAATSDYLAAVSFYAASPNSSYEIYIYLNPTSGPINPSGPVASKVGSLANAGYQTIPLDSPVQLTIGEKFSVVVKLTTPGYNWPIPYEHPFPGYSSAATANSGESYVSSNGTSWNDITNYVSNANVCLKAFTTEAIGLAVTPTSETFSYGPVGGPFNPPSHTYTLTNNSNLTINWSASKTQPWVSLSSENGTLEPAESTNVVASFNSNANSLPAGVYSDTITFLNTTNGVGSTTRNIILTVRDGSLQVSPNTDFESIGEPGGPFYPSSITYTLTNIGYSSLDWNATKTASWITLSKTSGNLEPGASEEVIVSIGPEAATLPVGIYYDTVTFTNTTNGDGGGTRNVKLEIAKNYRMEIIPINWVDPTNHTTYTLSDDGVTPALTIPFTFTFYGTAYTQLYVAANGMIGFLNNGLDAFSNTDIPNSAAPNAVLYPYWDDLDPSAAGSVKVGTEGTSPNRRFVISWVGVPHYSTPSKPFTFQVVLYENLNDIVFQYLEVQPEDTNCGAGRSATIGIENSSGNMAYKYSYDGSTLLSNNQAIRFTMLPRIGIEAAKSLPNDEMVAIDRAIISASWSSLFYIEADDRRCGIAVSKPYHGLQTGMRVNVVGTIKTNSNGERYIEAITAEQSPPPDNTGTVEPLLLSNRDLGGGDWNYDPITGAGQQGVCDKIGEPSPQTCNIGLLVCTTGRVTYSNPSYSYFYIDDGSGIMDSSGYPGIRVLRSGLSAPDVGKYVVVTGISSCWKSGSDIYRLLRPRAQSDIIVYD